MRGFKVWRLFLPAAPGSGARIKPAHTVQTRTSEEVNKRFRVLEFRVLGFRGLSFSGFSVYGV